MFFFYFFTELQTIMISIFFIKIKQKSTTLHTRITLHSTRYSCRVTIHSYEPVCIFAHILVEILLLHTHTDTHKSHHIIYSPVSFFPHMFFWRCNLIFPANVIHMTYLLYIWTHSYLNMLLLYFHVYIYKEESTFICVLELQIKIYGKWDVLNIIIIRNKKK